MRDRKRLVVISILLLLATTHLACQKAPGTKTQEKSDRAISQSTTTSTTEAKTAKELAREQGGSFSTQTEAMGYFFDTYFSGNLQAAYNITSVNHRNNPPSPHLMDEWRRFYEKAVEYGLNRKTLSCRSNFSRDEGGGIGGHSGVIISPSGRVIIMVFFRQLNNGYWQIDNLLMLEKALPVKSDNGFARTVLTNKPEDETYQALLKVLIRDVATPSGFKPSEIHVKQLVVCDGWARALLGVNKPGHETEQVILRKINGQWKVIDSGTGPGIAQYPESPFMIWVSDYK
jgi:hypothetical protein